MFVCSGNLAAKERRGAELIVQTQNGQGVGGELIAVKQNSLLLLDSRSGADVSVDIADIVLVQIVKKSKAGQGALFGFLAGAGLGAIVVAAGKAKQEEDPWQNFWESTFDVGAFVFLVLTGTIVGLTIGAICGKDQTIKFEGKSPEEFKSILAKLKKRARIPNFQ